MAAPPSPATGTPPLAAPLQLLRWRARTQVFVERTGGLELPMVRIPAGSFAMGSPEGEEGRSEREGPQHEVKLGEFLMGRTPITQAQWRAVTQWEPLPGERWERELNLNPSRFQPGGDTRLLKDDAFTDDRPVEQVSWHDAMEFCGRLSQRTGRHYILPSEAQWEYACRGGTTTPFAFGESLSDELANYDARTSYGSGMGGRYRQQTTTVERFPANAWGLQGMHGNVWEWCLDHWHDSYEGAPTDGSAWLNSTETNNSEMAKGEIETRLLRGGSWNGYPRSCRSAYRGHERPVGAGYSIGFRVVCLPQSPSLNP
jgi:formylglycine-generating enzyme required for sulfatase activity